MRKIFVLFIFLIVGLQSEAQFLNGIGITAGVSAANQKFYFYEPNIISRKKYVFGYNASFFAEFFSHDYARWVSEIQYNQKGSLDKQPPDLKYRNRLQYISWNNYLKLRYEMYSIIPYILLGPRLDYNLTQRTTSPVITSKFLKLHLSGAVGAGLEFVSFTNFKFLVEGFYNPDLMPAYVRPGLHIKNNNFELRVGLKYEFGSRLSCNTPVYTE
ncbi:MAG: hypothetical protein H0W84_05070 [Bacteroidetes bacterium]|nr:hypothetical protein [Bacteroidota bacterium]